MKIKTQRAWIARNSEEVRNDVRDYDLRWFVQEQNANVKTDLPVLVVPESAVRGCRHDWEKVGDWIEWCGNCGGIRGIADENWPYIRRPKILRIGRVKK